MYFARFWIDPNGKLHNINNDHEDHIDWIVMHGENWSQDLRKSIREYRDADKNINASDDELDDISEDVFDAAFRAGFIRGYLAENGDMGLHFGKTISKQKLIDTVFDVISSLDRGNPTKIFYDQGRLSTQKIFFKDLMKEDSWPNLLLNKLNEKDEPRTCKFCHKEKWWRQVSGPGYDLYSSNMATQSGFNKAVRGYGRKYYKLTCPDQECRGYQVGA